MIEINPPNPVEGDNINVTVFSGASPCAISSSTPSQIIDNSPTYTLEIDCAGIGNFGVPPPYGRIFQLGSLPAGDYTIIHTVVNGSYPILEQVALNVTAVKNVPVASPLGLILLSTLLLIMGKRLFKRRSIN